ncbi:MAG: PspA/IM30 family protein [Burkholderiaceae bacterium]|jgi:phage shock protein A|nr:PspA/IM30 family protein [Burkholderiaceae bacterium]
MTDSLRTRVARLIAGGAHALMDRVEGVVPVALLEQAAREVDQLTDEVRAELGIVTANRHLAQQQHLHLNQEHEELNAAIQTALAAGKEDLARNAVARQIDIEAQLPVLDSSLSERVQKEKELSGYVDALIAKRREMDAAIRDFEASRQQSAALGMTGSAATSTIEQRLRSAQAAFDRTHQRHTGLDAASQRAGMEQAAKLRELGELARDNKINERLAALKANQG